MKNIFIIRHGESEANANIRGLNSEQKEFVPDTDFELTELGKKQSYDAGKRIANLLKKGNEYNMYISPYVRTRQTANEVYEALIDNAIIPRKRIEDPRLAELDFGDFDCQLKDMWPQESSDSYKIYQQKCKETLGGFFARRQNGESLLDVYNRMSLFVTTRLEKELRKTKNHIIVTHGYAEKMLLLYLLQKNIEDVEKMKKYSNASVIYIVYYEDIDEYEYVAEL